MGRKGSLLGGDAVGDHESDGGVGVDDVRAKLGLGGEVLLDRLGGLSQEPM